MKTAIDYWKHTIEVQEGTQVKQMKRTRISNPMHVLGNKISVSDIEGLKMMKLSQHPQIMIFYETRSHNVPDSC